MTLETSSQSDGDAWVVHIYIYSCTRARKWKTAQLHLSLYIRSLLTTPHIHQLGNGSCTTALCLTPPSASRCVRSRPSSSSRKNHLRVLQRQNRGLLYIKSL